MTKRLLMIGQISGSGEDRVKFTAADINGHVSTTRLAVNDSEMRDIRRNYAMITRCPFCGDSGHVMVNQGDVQRWKNGALIQEVMPYLSVAEREMLITGICSPCFDKMAEYEREQAEHEQFMTEQAIVEEDLILCKECLISGPVAQMDYYGYCRNCSAVL